MNIKDYPFRVSQHIDTFQVNATSGSPATAEEIIFNSNKIATKAYLNGAICGLVAGVVGIKVIERITKVK